MSVYCPDCHVEYADTEEFCSTCGKPLSIEVSMDTVEPGTTVPGTEEILEHEFEQAQANPTHERSIEESLASLLRRGKTNTKAKPIPAAKTVDSDEVLQDVLPPHEQERGWRIVGDSLKSLKGYEQWQVAKTTASDEVRAVFRRYTTGSLTTKDTYETVLNVAVNAHGTMAKLYSYGTVDVGGGARKDYEIVALPHGQQLDVWLKEKGQPGIAPSRYLAPLLAGLLKRLRNMGLRPITLHPGMLWIDPANHVITLGILGTIGLHRDNDNFCADLVDSALLTLPYVAPELLGRRVIASTTETFAVGQILSQALFGEVRDHTYILEGSVPFAAIGDDVMRAVLMGTLWPKSDERWSVDQLDVALVPGVTDLPKCPPWQSLRPGAAKAAFTLAGEDFFLVDDLLVAASEHWDEALSRCDDILRFLEGTRFKGQAGLLRQEKRDGRSADWVLLRLHRLVLPEAPMAWREYMLGDDDAEFSLIKLAQRAMTEGEDSQKAQVDLQKLFDADLRGAFTINVTGMENQ